MNRSLASTFAATAAASAAGQKDITWHQKVVTGFRKIILGRRQ